MDFQSEEVTLVTSQSAIKKIKNKNKKGSQDQIFFRFPRAKATPTPPIHTTYLTILPYLFDWLLSSHFFLLLLFHFPSHTSLHSLKLSNRYLHTHHFHHHFSGVTGKSVETSKHLHLLFEVKDFNLFGGFYAFA